MEWSLSVRLSSEDCMNILGAIRREEKKVKKQLAKLQHDLIGLQSAAKALGKSANLASQLPRSMCCQPQGEQRFQKPPSGAGQSSERKQRRLSPNPHSARSLSVANSCLCRDWRVKETTTMATPTIRFQGRADVGLRRFFRCFAGETGVTSMQVVIIPELR